MRARTINGVWHILALGKLSETQYISLLSREDLLRLRQGHQEDCRRSTNSWDIRSDDQRASSRWPFKKPKSDGCEGYVDSLDSEGHCEERKDAGNAR